MYVLYNLEYTYISKHNESTKCKCMKARGSKGYACIVNSLDKIDIYMKFKHNHKTNPKMGIQV